MAETDTDTDQPDVRPPGTVNLSDLTITGGSVTDAKTGQVTNTWTGDPTTGMSGTGTSLDRLIATPAPSTDVPPEVQSGLADLQRRKLGADDTVNRHLWDQLNRDEARVRAAYDKTSADLVDVPKWDAQAEHRKYEASPLELFGSPGVAFAMIASAFTRTPMANALNGAAGAMEAIKAGDEAAYNRAYDAWKQNTALAFKRHEIMRQNYTDAVEMMKTDLTVGQARAQIVAAQFGDQKALFLIEHGMDKELIGLINDRNKMQIDMMTAYPKAQEEVIKQYDLVQSIREAQTNGEDPRDAIAKWEQRWKGVKDTLASKQIDIYNQFLQENPKSSAQDRADFLKRLIESTRVLSPDQEFTAKFYAANPKATPEEYRDAFGEWKKGQKEKTADQTFNEAFFEKNPDASYDDYSKAFGEFKKGQKQPPSGGITTEPRLRAQEISRRIEENKAAGMDPKAAYDKAVKDVNAAGLHITGNRRDEIQGRYDKATLSIATMDKATGILDKHLGAAGAAGYVTRTAESISNLLGSNATDRREFQRYINELKDWAPIVLIDRSGRPISAEADRMNSIIAGLSLGDTTANTKRAFKELKTLYKEIQGQMKSRIEGTWSPEGPGGAAPPPPSEKPPWANDPVVH